MDTLLSYRPQDLLLFSPRVYWAMVTGNNEAWWPLAILAPLAGLLLIWLIVRRSTAGHRLALAVTGTVWWFVTWSFLWQQYRSINWAADWAVAPFLMMGGLLLAIAMTNSPERAYRPHRLWVGLVLTAWGTLGHPLGCLLDDRGIEAADTWLLFPDPLAVTTLGIVLSTLTGWRLALALPVPLLWSLIGGATLLGLGSPIGWAMLFAAGMAVAGCLPLTQSQRGTC